MALVPEDGTGVNNADSYVTLAAFSSFLTDRQQGDGETDARKEAALRRAFRWLEATFGARWIGVRTSLSPLRSSWPRRSAYDAEGRNYSAIIPPEVKTAQMLLAVADLEEELDAAQGAAVVSEAVDVVSVSYATPTGAAMERRFRQVERELSHLLSDAWSGRMRRF